MERYRVVYYNADGEASEADVVAEDGVAAIKSIEDMGTFLSLESLGRAEPAPAPDEDEDE